MGDSGWAKYLKHPLVLVGFVMSILFSSLELYSANESSNPMVIAGYIILLVLSIIIVIAVLVLAFKEAKKEPSSKGVIDPSAGSGTDVVHSEGVKYPVQEHLKDKEKIIQHLERLLDEKNIALEESGQTTQSWVAKYEELEKSLDARDPNDTYVVCAREKIGEGDFDGAEECLKQSYESNMAGAEEQLKAAAADAFEIAQLKVLKLEYREALPFYEQAVKLEPDNSLYLIAYGYYLNDLGEPEKAIGYFKQALEIDKAAYGDNHPNVAIDLNNIGGAWDALGEPKKAIGYYEKALEIDKEAYGDNHPNGAIRLSNIGAAWVSLREPKKAIEYFEQSLEIDKAAYGDKHPNIAIRLNNIGIAWDGLGEPMKALAYYEQALEIVRAAYGEKHPHVAATLNNIGGAWSALGEPEKAIGYYEQALDMLREIFGDEHPRTTTARRNLESLKSELE